MNHKESNTTKKRQKYSLQFREQAVELAKKEGVVKTDLTPKKRTPH